MDLPKSVSDLIWTAVEEAFSRGVGVAEFLREVRGSWQEAIRRQGEAAEYELKKILK